MEDDAPTAVPGGTLTRPQEGRPGVAKNLAHGAWGWARQAAGITALLGIILFSIHPGGAQEEPVAPAQAREALRLAIGQAGRLDDPRPARPDRALRQPGLQPVAPAGVLAHAGHPDRRRLAAAAGDRDAPGH